MLSMLPLPRILVLVFQENLSEELLNKPIQLGIPNLKKVKFINFRVAEYETDFVMLFQKQGVVLEEIEVIPDQSNLSPIVLVKQSEGGEVLRSPSFSPYSSGDAES